MLGLIFLPGGPPMSASILPPSEAASIAGYDELGAAPFRGGLSRREIDEIRQSWRAHITAHGGIEFDRLDGFLTVLGFLPRKPAQLWLPLVLGDVFLESPEPVKTQLLDQLQRFQAHVARRVSLDPDAHREEVLPEFDFLPADDHESEEQAEARTGKAWSAGSALALSLDEAVVGDIAHDARRRDALGAFILLGRDYHDDGRAISGRERRRLMVAAAKGAHQFWKHYARPRSH